MGSESVVLAIETCIVREEGSLINKVGILAMREGGRGVYFLETHREPRRWRRCSFGSRDWQRLLPRQGFEVLPRRWVVKRTFAWLSHNRRMSKDYEKLCSTSESFVYAAMARLMVKRLARV